MTDRGCLRVGCKADVVAFDYDRVEDNSTIMNPDGAPKGIPWVLINGQIAIEDGQATGALAGVVIKRAGRPFSGRRPAWGLRNRWPRVGTSPGSYGSGDGASRCRNARNIPWRLSFSWRVVALS